MVKRATPTLTPDQSKAAREALTLSQKNVIEQSGIQAYKLKHFELGKYRLDDADQDKLRTFYELQGADFDAIDQAIKARLLAEKSPVTQRGVIAPSAAAGFLISGEVPQFHVDRVLDRMDENDSRIAELIAGAYTTGMFGDVTEETEAAVRELFGLLAESHLLFRFLQGKNIITASVDEPKTIGDKLSQWVKDSPAYEVFDLAASPAVPPKGKAKALPAGDSYDDQAED